MTILRGGVFGSGTNKGTDDLTELRDLADDIGSRSFESRIGRRSLPDAFDDTAWRHLDEAGLTRLVSSADSGGGPVEAAVLLRSLARHAVSVPVAETDVLAGWLAARADLEVPGDGPLTVAMAEARVAGDRVTATADAVPYAGHASAVVLALRDGDRLLAAVADPAEVSIRQGHNAGGEPRDTVGIDLAADRFVELGPEVDDELNRRGAWARCIQVVGALDAAVEFSVAHTREREQFGRPLSAFQSVQHTLASMAGEVERGRAAADLAVAAAADHGFAAAQTDYAVTVAKVTLGRVVPAVVTSAHQLHGAIGATIEHRLWLVTMRARSWIAEFGDTAGYARRLGRRALSGGDPWQLVVDGGC